MSTLVLLRYSNYYNRIVKKESTLSQYRTYQIGVDIEGVNFIPNDYINTTQIINWDYSDPDYLLVVENNVIKSRWFIISTTRVREGQLQLELHRDLVADYYDSILNAKCFIEKATINDIDDPAIYNNEDMTFNQIKQGEYPLKDNSGTAWIVGYVPRDGFDTGGDVTASYNYQGIQDITVDKLSDYQYYQYTNKAPSPKEFIGSPVNVYYRINTYATFTSAVPGGHTATLSDDFTISMDSTGNYAGISGVVRKGSYNYTGDRTYRYIGNDIRATAGSPDIITIDGTELFANFTSSVMASMNAYQTDYLTASTPAAFNLFMDQNGKIIYNKEDEQYYKIRVSQVAAYPVSETRNISVNSGLYTVLKNNLPASKFSGSANGVTFQIKGSTYNYKMTLELLSTSITTYVGGDKERYHLNDAPYDMFCIPYPEEGQILDIYKNGSLYIKGLDRGASFNMAISIASSLGSGSIYDVQLLPYCPIKQIIKENGTIDIGDISHSPINITVGSNTRTVSVLLWSLSSEFNVTIPFIIPQSTSILEKKVKNETEFWRLCSPNYSGLFEFSAEKNNGVSYIDIDCNYKPYSPYIHAAINFNNLYGRDFNDSRGLICGGDFSLPQVTDKWADYQLNNKNYQQMFDRQIQNMEVNNAVQREREIWGIAAGAVGAGSSGATAGALAAGPVGALAGVATAGLSLAGGIRDLSLNDKLRNEALDYKRDMFGYQLQNIKALPQGLAKVSAFTANNKIFPFMEKYSCKEKEIQALKDKLKYNGMTIMRIGTIAEFKQSTPSYIKGRLIRLENISEDFHIINAIADEIYKGVYI